jgi:hypothetical protein
MKKRPDWVHCIGFRGIRMDGKATWCGQNYELEPFFMDADHAAQNGEQKGRLVACPECVARIVEALQNGH